MNLPITFVLGLLVLATTREWWFVLPGSGNLALALACMPLLVLPALLARPARPGASRWARRRERLGAGTTPIVYGVLLGPGGWIDLVDRWSGDSRLLGCALAAAPLFVVELLLIEAEAAREGREHAALHRRQRWSFVALFAGPWLAMAAISDALQAYPVVHAFVTGTSPGVVLGMLLFVIVLGVVLPLLFRWLLALRPLQEPHGDELRATAAALGFPGRRVLWLDSGLRTVNALMLGPLPWPRYLVLSDGLMTVLGNDVNALQGVVAHEVGHAQAGHPTLLTTLFVVVPLLLASSVQLIAIENIDGVWLVLGGLLLVLVAWRIVRAVGHRFEHEADVLSAIALGGAEPCIRALQRVGTILAQDPVRASLMHPSERARVQLLQRFAAEPAFRARFALRGLQLRRAIGAIVVVAVLVAAWCWYTLWPIERALVAYRVGDFAAARAQVEAVGTQVPAGQWELWHAFRDELDAASAIAGAGGDWRELRERLAAEGWRRGVEVLLANGGAAARPWFALATEVVPRSPLRDCLQLYCEAARDNDLDRMELVRSQVRALGVPPELRAVFGD